MSAEDFHKSKSQIIKNIYDHAKKSIRILIKGPSAVGVDDDVEVTTSTVAGNKNAMDVASHPKGLRGSGKTTEVFLNEWTWKALPPAALTGRVTISIQNTTAYEIKIGYTNTGGYVGITVPSGWERTYKISDDIILYGRFESGGSGMVIAEELAS